MRTWLKCAWHKTEFWFSDSGDTALARPVDAEFEKVSHGICKGCLTAMQAQLQYSEPPDEGAKPATEAESAFEVRMRAYRRF